MPDSWMRRVSMPDITAVLERAAGEPTRAPELERPYRRARRRRYARVAATVVSAAIVGVVVGVVVGAAPDRHPPVVVRSEPPPQIANSHDASISVAPGWTTSSEPLA